MVEIIVSVAATVAEYLVAPVGRQFSYLCNYKSNFDNLNEQLNKLTAARERVQHRIDEAKRKGEEIEESVDKWLIKVTNIIDGAGKFLEDEGKANNRCFKGLCPNLKTRYQLSKKAEREVKAVVAVQEEEKFDRISYRIIPEDMWFTSDKLYEVFQSRESTLKDIMSTLSNPDVNMIGVYGMGGVGKTTLVKKVAILAKKDKLFDEVVFANVSQIPDVRKIQGEIADKLGLEFFEETESGRARRLYERLGREKKLLVILDNIWTSLDLETIGIPFGEGHKESKILLTARSEDVLSNKMDSQKNFLIDVLDENEAWSLFTKMAGDYIRNHDLHSVAIEIVKACAGLPIAIVTVAKALRNKTIYEWKDALRQLRRPSPKNFAEIPATTYSSIEVSYNHLEGEELKSTFLLISYANISNILDLLKYGMGLGIFQGINSMDEARDRVYALVHKLKSSCLLLDGYTSEEFLMHDIVHDVAISIASRDLHVFSISNEVNGGQRDWPDNDTLKHCTAISLVSENIELPAALDCPQLELFCIYTENHFLKIPDKIFTCITKLRVLDLTGMHIFLLPSSLQLLENLRTLCLDQCVLEDISIVGSLQKLEILSFYHSTIEKLPVEFSKLTKLRFLDLTNCFNLKVIAPNVISSLFLLEELHMANCFVEWEVEGLSIERSNASLNELIHLSHLTTLEINIKNDNVLPKDLFSRLKLERYRVLVGDCWPGFDEHESSRTLKLKLDSNTELEKLQGVKNVEQLCLDQLQGFKNILYEMDGEGFLQLKHLSVKNNPHFLCIVDLMESIPHEVFPVFPLLESLILSNLINLERVCYGQPTIESFSNLRIIEVKSCAKLKNIFSFSMARCFPQLQTIEVNECKNMEEIFVTEREDDVNIKEIDKIIEFAQLRSISLGILPRLANFCSKVETSAISQKGQKELVTNTWSNTRCLDEIDAPNPLFSHKVVFPNLEALELSAINCENIWHSQLAALSCLHNLTRLIVEKCHKLKYIFTSTIVKSFEQLEHLEICNCKALEEIVVKEDGAEAADTFVFPEVTFLKLYNLPELRTFYSGIHTSEWPVLKELEIYGCDKVRTFTSEYLSFQKNKNRQDIAVQQSLFLIEKVNPNLEKLLLSGKDIRMIEQGKLSEHLFSMLKFLDIVKDESTDVPLGFLMRFRHLEKLELRRSSYKEIIPYEEGKKDAVGMVASIKCLRLWGLSDLKHLWKQDSQLDSILQNLEILDIHYCDNLINLLPASFQNLTTLEVWWCNGLMNLMTSSTAKGLVRLREMRMYGCKMMTEIVTNEKGETMDEIVFTKLKWMSLECLESLTSFCSRNYTFTFPSLEELIVSKCPKMKTFCGGVLTTPRLFKVKEYPWDEGLWEGDLNKTIQQSHKIMNGQCSENDSGQHSMQITPISS